MSAPAISGVTVASTTSVTINYTAYTGGLTFTRYSAQYSVNSGSTWLPATPTIVTANTTTLTLTYTGLANGTSYVFRVSAMNGAAFVSSSAASSSVLVATVPAQVVTWTLAPKPSTSGTLLISAVTAPVANDTSITGYNVQTSLNGTEWSSATLYAVASTYDISGLTNGTLYHIKMAAVNRIGTGLYSTSKTATPRTVPDQVGTVTPTPGNVSVSLAWSAPATGGSAITGYKVERSVNNSIWTQVIASTPSSPYNVTGLTNGTLYYFRISAINAAGTGTPSASVSSTPRTIPGAPTIGSVSASSSTAVSVPFTAPVSNGGNAITSYVVTPYIGAVAQTTVSGASSPISVTGLTTGQLYTFKVHAVNEAGSGTQSAASSSVTLVYSSVSAPSGASFTYASGASVANAKITYTGIASSDAVITPTGTAWTIVAGGNTDTLNGVRKIVFTDKIIYLAGSGIDTATDSSTVGSYTMTKTIVGGSNVISAYITDAATEYTANSKVAVIYIAGDTIYTANTNPNTIITSPVSIVGITLNSKKPLITRLDNYTLRFLLIKSSNVTIENIICDLNITSTLTETNAGAIDIGFINGNLTLLENIVFKNVDMVRAYQKGINMNYVTNVIFDGCNFARASVNATIAMSSCKNVTIKNCTVPRSGSTLTGFSSISISTSHGPRDIYNYTGSGINPQPTFNNNRSQWSGSQKLEAIKTTNIDLSLNNTFTDNNSLFATIQLNTYRVDNGADTFQYMPTFTGANPDIKLPSDFGYSFSHLAAVGTAILKTNITKNSTDITGLLASWGFAPTDVTVRRLDTNARIYPSGYELPVTTFDPTTITTETTVPLSIGGTRTEVPVLDSNSLSELSALRPVLVKSATATPKLAVFTSSDPGAAVKKSIDDGINAVAIQRTVKGATKTSVIEVNKRSAITSVVATKTVGGQTQTATADITSLPSTHSVILTVDDIDGTAGLKANIFFKVIDGSGNTVTSGLSLPIEFDVPGTDAIPSLDLYTYNTTTSNYEKTGTLTKKVGTTTTFSYTFTTNSDYQLSDPASYDSGYVPCFPAGVRILTSIGYRAVETLRSGELIQTADGRSVAIKVYTTTLKNVSAKNAPYLIPSHTFGRNSPPADLRLSGLHAFQVKKGLWKVPAYANNSKITQYGVGETITYYHIECPNYFRDNLVAEGCVVESYAAKQVNSTTNIFRYNRRLDAFTRTAENAKISHA